MKCWSKLACCDDTTGLLLPPNVCVCVCARARVCLQWSHAQQQGVECGFSTSSPQIPPVPPAASLTFSPPTVSPPTVRDANE